MGDAFLVYMGGGEQFHSRIVMGKEKVFDVVIEMIFGEEPDPNKDEDKFDQFVEYQHDFNNEHLWQEYGNVWETDFDKGFLVVVRISMGLN